MLKELVITIQSWIEAQQFIRKHKLWGWVIIPGMIYSVLFIAAMYFFGKSSTAVIEYITHILNLGNWIQQFKTGLPGFLFAFTGVTLWLTLFIFYFSFFKYICLILGSPIFAYLSRKAENIIDEKDHEPKFNAVTKEMGRGILLALRNCAWQTLYFICLILLALIPVVGWIIPLIALMVECYYYGCAMLDYNLERHDLSINQSMQFVGRHKGLAIGTGLLFFLTHLVIVLAPAFAIISATLTVYKVKTTS